MSIFVSVLCYFDYCSLVLLSEVQEGYVSSFILFPQDCLLYFFLFAVFLKSVFYNCCFNSYVDFFG